MDVGGTSSCPSPADVQRRLGSAGASSHHAIVNRDRDVLSVQLLDESGAVLAEKTLREQLSEPESLQSGRCEKLAEVASVLISAWEAQFQERVLAVPAAEHPEHPEPPPPPKVEAPKVVFSELPPVRPSLELEGGLSGGAGYSDTVAAEGQAFFALGRSDTRYSLLGTFTVGGARNLTLGSGVVRWYRLSAAAGPRARLYDGPVRVSFDLRGGVTRAVGHGEGFAQRSTGFALYEPALFAELTAFWPRRLLRPFAALQLAAWPSRQELVVGQLDAPDVAVAQGALPRWEVLLHLGISLGTAE